MPVQRSSEAAVMAIKKPGGNVFKDHLGFEAPEAGNLLVRSCPMIKLAEWVQENSYTQKPGC